MKYVSFDVETTGLDTRLDQVLQVAMVAEDSSKPEVPIEELPTFTCLVEHDRYAGSAFALALNAPIFKALADAQPATAGYKASTIRGRHTAVWADWGSRGASSFDSWEAQAAMFLSRVYAGDEGRPPAPRTVILAGKNVAGFDLQFVTSPSLRKLFSHRVLDIGSVFADFDKEKLPSLDEIKADFGITTAAHDALDDARDVIRALRTLYGTPRDQ